MEDGVGGCGDLERAGPESAVGLEGLEDGVGLHLMEGNVVDYASEPNWNGFDHTFHFFYLLYATKSPTVSRRSVGVNFVVVGFDCGFVQKPIIKLQHDQNIVSHGKKTKRCYIRR